jgi:septal ring factor EnvC (AmiA/AmiB activator)
LIIGTIFVGLIVYTQWLFRRVGDLERKIHDSDEERAGLGRQIADLEGRLRLRTKEYQAAAETLQKSAADIDRLTDALKTVQTQHLEPPKPPKGIGPVRRL